MTPPSGPTAVPVQVRTDPALVAAGLGIIRSHQHPSGAYPASPTFSAYRGYCWFRDGAFIAEAMRRSGEPESAAAFHTWCADVLVRRQAHVESLVSRAEAGMHVRAAEMLPARFTLDGRDGVEPWWNFQLDGYGTWLWALAHQVADQGLPAAAVVPAARLAVAYLSAFGDQPCYDWWEEHDQHRHVSTLGAVRGGLHAALSTPELCEGLALELREAAEGAVARLDDLVVSAATSAGHLVKWIGSSAVDASLVSCLVAFDLPLSPALRSATLTAVEDQLSVDGGVHRYLDDTFYGGGQWPLLSAFVAWAHVLAGDRAAAAPYLRWVEAQATDDGELPEQVDHHLLAPDRQGEWQRRWGDVATPLLWSHAMYLIVNAELDRDSRKDWP